MDITYVLPLRSAHVMSLELEVYLEWLSQHVELIVVDGSDDAVWDAHARRWTTMALQHQRVDDRKGRRRQREGSDLQ